jgi:hypothetical protein
MGIPKRRVRFCPPKKWRKLTSSTGSRMQTPLYTLYPVPTIVSAAILLTTRNLSVPLPENWWELFDADWEDVWSACGRIMRLYRTRSQEDMVRVAGMVGKKEVRKWLDEHAGRDVVQNTTGS